MDATVVDFFKEINEIAPTKDSKSSEVWQECYDELTGYSYYWNTKTDEVTWTAPSKYTPAENKKKTTKGNTKKKNDLYVPPKIAPPLLPCTSRVPQNSVKIYSVQQNVQKVSKLEQTNIKSEVKTSQKKPYYRQHSDSEDEKIELITSYGGDSESDTEVERQKGNEKYEPENLDSDEDDESDLLAKIQQRAKELQQLENQTRNDAPKKVKTKNISGFSLVAGYSDSDSETEPPEPVKPVFPLNINQGESTTSQVSHSTLFPIAQPVDIKDFETKKEPPSEIPSTKEDFDSKAFQRKRRIGISLVNSAKKSRDSLESEVTDEKKGFGFSDGANQDTLNIKKENPYAGFQKGGVLFVKPEDTLQNLSNKEESNNSKSTVDVDEIQNRIEKKEVKENYSLLKEKLTFLIEGHEAVLPVQVMLIQADTLFLAMEENGLKLSYLQKWLSETRAELIKLEKEAAPVGWLLQWDRLNKRYYYQNQSTGVSQWDYPQSSRPPPPMDEVSGREDVPMDICTTPPHPGIPEQRMSTPSPPLPPCIKSPSPPPPPIISVDEKSMPNIPDVPLPPSPPPPPPPPPPSHPPPPPPPISASHDGEPLPPGVDLPEMISYNNVKEIPKDPVETNDPLNSALDSFYSEIAASETTLNSPVPQDEPAEPTNQLDEQIAAEPVKKKKKTKVKLAPGLSMKKKGVSQLVEKWKNVQKSYDD